MLNEKEQKKLEVIKKVVNNEMTRKEAMYELDKSRQQIYRLINIYINEGEKGFIHKNRGKENVNKKDITMVKELKDLYLTDFYDFNFVAFYELITEDEKYMNKYDISYSFMYNEFLNDDIISPLAHKGTIKLYNERMNNSINDNNENISEAKKELFESRKIAFEQAHTRRSSNLYSFGEEIQMDACEKVWFGNVVTYLHLAVDKATKKVLFAWFDYEEITRGYFILLFNIIVNYGIPKKIKADNRNSFSNQGGNVDATQFGRICNILGIELETNSNPRFKPNVENKNKTYKNRLIAELRYNGITDIDEANKYVNEVFNPKMNKKFSYEIDPKTSKMKPNNYPEEELKLIISEKYKRIIDNTSSIKYDNKYYVPVDPDSGEIVCFKKQTECTFIINYDYEYWCEIEKKYYKLVEIKDRDTTMKKEIDNNKPVERKKYIPPANHPWRKKFLH